MPQQLITQQQAAQLVAALQEWSNIPEQKTVADLLDAVRRPIAQMIGNGVSYDDIAAELVEFEITVTADAIAAYVLPAKGKGSKRNRKSAPPELHSAISNDVFEKVVARIKELAKQKRGLTRAEFVAANYQVIELCLAAGKSYPKIAAFLDTRQGIKVAASTLAKYHRKAKQARISETQTTADSPTVHSVPSESQPKATTGALAEPEIDMSSFNL
ncbi:MAG: hypothetical protein AAF821_00115 [Cyanobacteria bacterium P01_D01_bin.156]